MAKKRESVSFAEKQHFDKLCRQTKPLMLLNTAALMIVLATWQLVFQPLTLERPLLLLAVTLIPLLLLTPGIIKGGYRAAIWMCFVTLIYFVAGVLNWTASPRWAYGMSETLLSVILFIIALMYARWKAISELPVE